MDQTVFDKRRHARVTMGILANQPHVRVDAAGETHVYQIEKVKGKQNCYKKAAERLGYKAEIDHKIDDDVNLPMIDMIHGTSVAFYNVLSTGMMLIIRESNDEQSRAHAFTIVRRAKSGVFTD
jgi:hypothetical protein